AHKRVRGPLAQIFYRRVAGCRPVVESIVADKLARIEGAERFDVVSQFAELIPVEVLATFLGVDKTRLPEFRRWAADSMLIFNPIRSSAETARMLAAQDALRSYFLDLISQRRQEPREDYVSDMVAAQAEGAGITDMELQINFRAVLN